MEWTIPTVALAVLGFAAVSRQLEGSSRPPGSRSCRPPRLRSATRPRPPSGGSGFIAAFVGGAVLGGLRRRVGGEVGYLLEQLGGLLGAATFVVFGGTLLEPALGHVTWAVACYAVLSLTLVRMAPVAIAMIGTRARPPTVAFLGWSARAGWRRSCSPSC